MDTVIEGSDLVKLFEALKPMGLHLLADLLHRLVHCTYQRCLKSSTLHQTLCTCVVAVSMRQETCVMSVTRTASRWFGTVLCLFGGHCVRFCFLTHLNICMTAPPGEHDGVMMQRRAFRELKVITTGLTWEACRRCSMASQSSFPDTHFRVHQ